MITESAFEVSMVHNWHKEAINGFTSKLEKHRTFHLKQSLQSRQIPCVTGNIHLHCHWTPKRSTHRQEFHFLVLLIIYLHRFLDHCQCIGCNLIELIGHSSPWHKIHSSHLHYSDIPDKFGTQPCSYTSRLIVGVMKSFRPHQLSDINWVLNYISMSIASLGLDNALQYKIQVGLWNPW